MPCSRGEHLQWSQEWSNYPGLRAADNDLPKRASSSVQSRPCACVEGLLRGIYTWLSLTYFPLALAVLSEGHHRMSPVPPPLLTVTARHMKHQEEEVVVLGAL